MFTEIIFRICFNCVKNIFLELDDGFPIFQKYVLSSIRISTIPTASRLHKSSILNADLYIFRDMFSDFVPLNESTCFKIINKQYLYFITEESSKIHTKTFIHILHQ